MSQIFYATHFLLQNPTALLQGLLQNTIILLQTTITKCVGATLQLSFFPLVGIHDSTTLTL